MRKTSCTDPLSHLIGEIAMAFGNLELQLELAIWLLIAGSDEDIRRLAETLTAEMSFDRKVNAFFSLYKIRYPDEASVTQLSELIDSLFAVQERRNAILHSAWGSSSDGTVETRLKSSARAKRSRGLRHTVSRASPRQIAEVRDQILAVGQGFGRFVLERIQSRIASKPSRGK